MARYIKANPKVVQYLHLENDRNRLKDGNYLLWQADMLAFGKLVELPEILEKIGGIALQSYEARQEQDGTACRELPIATDSRFVVEKKEGTEESVTDEQQEENADEVNDTDTGEESEQTENSGEAETDNEETEV